MTYDDPLDDAWTCHFCGGDSADCDCTTACAECGHIGHEHYADGRCRGTVYDMGPARVESCHRHQYEPIPI